MDQTDNFADAFVIENVAYSCNVVATGYGVRRFELREIQSKAMIL